MVSPEAMDDGSWIETNANGPQAKKNQTLQTYLEALNPNDLCGSFGYRVWNDVHGDCKSSVKGGCSMELMERSNGKFGVRVRQGKEVVMEFDYDSMPTLVQVGEDVKARGA